MKKKVNLSISCDFKHQCDPVGPTGLNEVWSSDSITLEILSSYLSRLLI